MTYENKGFQCDECSDWIEPDGIGFHDRWALAKEQGWRSFKGPDNKWANVCPACVAKYAETRHGR